MEASTGSLEILVDEKEEFEFKCVKVADYKNGEFVLNESFEKSGVNLNDVRKGSDLRKAIERLTAHEIQGTIVKTKNQVAKIESLSEGVYLLQCLPKEGYEVSPILVSIPQWDVDEKEMSYHVNVIPKTEHIIETVDTGDSINVVPLIGLCIFSLIIVMIISGKAYFLKDK